MPLATSLQRHWFLVALLVVLAAGICFPTALAPIAKSVPRAAIVASVLFLMSLTLAADAMWRAVRQPGPALLAVGINAGLAAPLAWLFGHMLSGDLAVGLIVAAAVPCTLASAAVWTRRAGGNDAVALLVTMITNLACFLVVPLWLAVLVGTQADVNFLQLVARLFQLAVIPIAVGQVLRLVAPVAAWADANKTELGAAALIGILSIVLLGAVQSGAALASTGAINLPDGVQLVVVVVALHVALLFSGLWTARAMRMSEPDAAAVAMAGSQKTLMVGLDVALSFGGLAILPMVAYHAVQLLLDTVVADRLRERSTTQ